MDRKRLLVVSPSLHGGGAERFASTLLAHLDRSRFECHLCLFRDRVTYPLRDDVTRHLVPKSRPWHTPGSIIALRRLLRDVAPDVVLGVMGPVGWLLAAARGHDRHPRLVVRLASSTKRRVPRTDVLAARLVWSFLRRADRLVPNSEALGHEVRARLGRERESVVEVIGNPLDLEQMRRLAAAEPSGAEPADGPTVVSVGRLTRVKRPDILLDAFAHLTRDVRATLFVLGDGPLREAMERRARRLGIAGQVRFVGFVPNPYAWLARADLFVLTSDFEGLPNALIEAQALGVPAVATRCPTGPEEIVEHGVTGELVKVGSVKSVSEAMGRLLADAELRADMGKAAAARMRARYAVGPIVRRWEELLRG